MSVDCLSLAIPGVQGLRPYEPGKPISELEREYGISDIIKLASNENPLGPSPKALAAIRDVLGQLARYPDGNGFELKSALADKFNVSLSQITLGNGSNDLLELLARAFLLPENEVVFSEHAFAVYPIVTQAVGAKAVVVPAKNWGNDLDAMVRAITPRTRLVFIANPNNPTGTWLDSRSLKTFLESVPEHVIVVIDEAYFEYVDEPTYPDCSRWLPDHQNLVVTRTFSKAYGLAGLRVGYSLSSERIADLLNRVRQPFNVNALALHAAVAALGDQDHLAKGVALNREGMIHIERECRRLGLSFIPSAGNFIAIHFEQPADSVYQALLKAGIIVRPLANYGMSDYLRVTIGLKSENERFLSALENTLGRSI